MNQQYTPYYFKLFMEAFPGVVSYIDQEHRYQFVSPNYQSWFGAHPREVEGKLVASVLGEETYELRRPYIERALKGEKIVFQSILRHQEFGLRNTEQIYHPDIDDDGNVKGVFAMAQDVTEKVQANREAQEGQKIWRTYAESMPQMAFIASPHGEVIYFNKRWLEYSGIDPYEDSQNTEKLIHPEDRERTSRTWQESINTGKVYQIEYRVLCRDGNYYWHLGRAIPVRNSEGQIQKWMGTTTNIHDYKEIESYQARLLQVMDSSSDFIGMATLEGQVLYLNKVGRQLVGLDDAVSLLEIHRASIIHGEDLELFKNEVVPAVKEEGNWKGEIRFKHQKTGEPIWVHYNSFVTKDEKTGEITGVAAIARDISEIKNRERNLESALRSRDEFLSIASHELKTPLTSLKLQSQLFLRSLKKGNKGALSQERLESMAGHTDDLVSRLSRLIDDMLDVSRIRTGRLYLEKSPHDLYEVAKHVVERMSLQFQAAGVESPSICGTSMIIGEWDRFRLEQVLGNLLTNAIRYGQGKPVGIEVVKDGRKAILKVIDQGYGISKADQERIFSRFERAINASEVSGMGLGLFITKEIVKSHDGEIRVESELGQGATFIVELPL